MVRATTGVVLVAFIAPLALAAESAAPGPGAKPAAEKAAAAKPTDKVGAPGVARPRFVIKAEKGFIDDPFALDPEGGNLAVLLTDAASFARIDLIDLATGKPKKTVELAAPQRLFERLVLVPGGKGVVLISRDTASTKRTAQYFDAAGAPAGALGPFDDFGVVRRGNETLLLAWQKSAAADGEATCTVAAHHLAGLAPAGKPVAYTLSKSNALKQPPLEDVEWQDGYGQVVGVRADDKQGDDKKGPHAVVLDTLTGAVAWQGEAPDHVGWTAARELRRKTPGRSSFLVFSPDTRVLEHFDFLGRHAPVTLAAPVAAYDATTLVEQQDFAAGLSLFSLALDQAGAAAKPGAPARVVDLYRVETAAAKAGGAKPAAAKAAAKAGAPAGPTVARLLRAPMDDRPVAWAVSGSHAALLRKNKDFTRGGAQLELYTW